jgi:hypothetical protein
LSLKSGFLPIICDDRETAAPKWLIFKERFRRKLALSASAEWIIALYALFRVLAMVVSSSTSNRRKGGNWRARERSWEAISRIRFPRLERLRAIRIMLLAGVITKQADLDLGGLMDAGCTIGGRSYHFSTQMRAADCEPERRQWP